MTRPSSRLLPVLCYGEALVDMLAEPSADAEQPQHFVRYAGGAPANVAVAVAKLGGDARFVGMVGEDMFGEFVSAEMRVAGVDLSHLKTTSAANTALAFVALDAQGERTFSFYRNPSADMLFRASDFQPEMFARPGLMHVCSNTLTTPETAAVTLNGIQMAQAHGWLISFDLNLRHNLWPAEKADLEAIWPLLEQASIIKMSREELEYLMEGSGDSYSQFIDQLFSLSKRSGRSRLLFITDGEQPTQVFWLNGSEAIQSCSVRPRPMTVKDTTGAGDAFSGAVLYQLAEILAGSEDLVEGLNSLCSAATAEADIQQLTEFANRCGGFAVTRHGAFAAMPSQDSLSPQTPAW